jgi:hypothetical protein
MRLLLFFFNSWKLEDGIGKFFATNARIRNSNSEIPNSNIHNSNSEDFSDHCIWQASIKKEKFP